MTHMYEAHTFQANNVSSLHNIIYINLIILSAKHHIYCCKCQHRRPLFYNFYSYLKRIFTLEEYIAKTTNKYEVFLGKWNVVFHDLKN